MPAFAQAPRGAADNSPALAGRLERLEEQVVNLQGVVAAVETLAKNSGGGSGYTAAASGGASPEQVRQLSEQIAELTQRLERLEARLGANTGPAGEQPRQQTGYNTVAPAGGFDEKEQLPALSAPQAATDRYPAQAGQHRFSTANGQRRPALFSAPRLRRRSFCSGASCGASCARRRFREFAGARSFRPGQRRA